MIMGDEIRSLGLNAIMASLAVPVRGLSLNLGNKEGKGRGSPQGLTPAWWETGKSGFAGKP